MLKLTGAGFGFAFLHLKDIGEQPFRQPMSPDNLFRRFASSLGQANCIRMNLHEFVLSQGLEHLVERR